MLLQCLDPRLERPILLLQLLYHALFDMIDLPLLLLLCDYHLFEPLKGVRVL